MNVGTPGVSLGCPSVSFGVEVPSHIFNILVVGIKYQVSLVNLGNANEMPEDLS